MHGSDRVPDSQPPSSQSISGAQSDFSEKLSKPNRLMSPAHKKGSSVVKTAPKRSVGANSSLLNRMADGEVQLLLQFAGQGNPYFQDFKNLYQQDQLMLEDFFTATIEAIREQFDSSDNQMADVYFDKFQVRRWMEHNIPEIMGKLSGDILYSAPLVFAFQVMNVIRFERLGCSHEILLRQTSAAVGHSLGMNAALFLSQRFASEEDRLQAFRKNVAILFWLGYRSKECYLRLDPASFPFTAEESPMLIVRGKRDEVEKELRQFSSENGGSSGSLGSQEIVIGLENMSSVLVICGLRQQVRAFRDYLKVKKVGRGFEFLNTSCPFHTPIHQKSSRKLYEDHKRVGFALSGEMLANPVICNFDGSDLQKKEDLSAYLSEISLCRPLYWPQVMQRLIEGNIALTHSLNFGPGTMLQSLAERMLVGTGVSHLSLISREEQTQFISAPVRKSKEKPWEEYAPNVTVATNGENLLHNAFTKFTGFPPIFGGGMTPTTVEIDLSVAAANSGRLVEWAGGGQVTESLLRHRLDKMTKQLKPGAGIVMNLLYLDAYLWNLQNPLVIRLKKEGYPLHGVTISAGIPDLADALKILQGYEDVGLWMNSFKPGTTKQIESVLRIAKAVPRRQIIMQVEGGAAGGHHSWERLEALIKENYPKIRKQSNVILAVGGGIATPEQATQWLNGKWNQSRLQPVDAVFLGTRLMACEEAHTSPAIKEDLIRLQGSQDFLAGKQEGKDLGGIISGKSGLGADIHYANNHWSQTSAWLAKMVKGLKTPEARQKIAENKVKIIQALDKTPKPYFGDVALMTYQQVLERFVELTCPSNERLVNGEGPWPDAPFIDSSYRSRLLALLQRFENRFAKEEQVGQNFILSQDSIVELDEPQKILKGFFGKYPSMKAQQMLEQDVYFFQEVCMRPGKPMNFIPILDENIVKWYRSDSLWYAHCSDVDTETCAWIPGPLAVRGISQANEKVVSVLTQFENFSINTQRQAMPEKETLTRSASINREKSNTYKNKRPSIKSDSRPLLDWVSLHQKNPQSQPQSLASAEYDGIVSLQGMPERGWDADGWWEAILALVRGPIGEFFTAHSIIKGKKLFPQTIQNLLQPVPELIVRWKTAIASESENEGQSIVVGLDFIFSEESGVRIHSEKDTLKIQFLFGASYLPETPISLERSFQRKESLYRPIFVEDIQDYGKRVNQLYRKLWVKEKTAETDSGEADSAETDSAEADSAEADSAETDSAEELFVSHKSKVVCNMSEARALLMAVSSISKESSPSPMPSKPPAVQKTYYTPFSIVLIWNNMLQTLLDACPHDDILSLLHVDHRTEWEEDFFRVMRDREQSDGDSSIEIGEAKSWVRELSVETSGKRVQIVGEILAASRKLLSFQSTFFIRGSFQKDSVQSFLQENEKEYLITMQDDSQRKFFTEIEGLTLTDAEALAKESTVRVVIRKHCDIRFLKNEKETDSFQVLADLLSRTGKRIGKIDFQNSEHNLPNISKMNPVIARLRLLARESNAENLPNKKRVFSQAYDCPQDMHRYAESSRDFNPIHTQWHFAYLADLFSPIVHGIYNFNRAMIHTIDQQLGGEEERLVSFQSNFTDKVELGARIVVDAYKQGQEKGNSIYELQSQAIVEDRQPKEPGSESGTKKAQLIAQSRAVARPPTTVYFFTGQGSQYPGMGMDVYDENLVARKVWDEAELTCNREFGFSLLRIVRENPKTLRVRGNDFFHPEGVLNLTQFTQVAIVVKSVADWHVLEARQLIASKYYYCGHSLGEYAALAAQGMMNLQNLVRLVYARGNTMQNYIERDEKGRSGYAMSVILGLVKIGLDEAKIRSFVKESQEESGELLEIVNFNIRNRQYSVTGTVRALEILEAKLEEKTKGHRAYIRLKGIDVPFHSSLLLKGVDQFREVLNQKLPENVDYSLLDTWYIPNLVARPFAMTTEFLQCVYEHCESPVVKEMQKLAPNQLVNNENRRLLFMELLSYQFAKPVLWIQTQDVLFHEKKVRRVIEIGPRGDLAGMARQTIRGMSEKQGDFQISHLDEERAHIFGEDSNEEPSLVGKELAVSEMPQAAPVIVDAPVARDKTVPAIVDTPVAREAADSGGHGNASCTPIEDRHPRVHDGLIVFLANKAQIRPDEISLQETIENIFQGNSSKRNQALADLGAEFATTALDGAHEKPLAELIETLEEQTGYKGPGPYLRTLSEEFMKAKMPAGFGRAEMFRYFKDERLLGDGHCLTLSMYVPLYARTGKSLGSGEISAIALAKRLTSADQAKDWLAKAVDLYGVMIGQSIPTLGTMEMQQGSKGGQVSSAVVAELEAKYFGIDGTVARLLRYGQEIFFGQDPFEKLKQVDRATLELQREELTMTDWWEKDHGKEYARKNQSRFYAEKIVWLQNTWQWTKRNLLQSFWSFMHAEDEKNWAGSKRSQSVSRQIATHATLPKYRKELQSLVHGLKKIAKETDQQSTPEQGNKNSENTIHWLEHLEKDLSDNSPVYFRPSSQDGPYSGQLEMKDRKLFFHETEHGSYATDNGKWVRELFADGMIHLQDMVNPLNEQTHTKQWQEFWMELLQDGVDLSEKSVLVTGAGKNSIALEIVQYLLRAGATVVLGTSTFNEERLLFYKKLYQKNASLGAKLMIVPFSQASMDDCENLIRAAFEAGLEIDCLIPFGAIGEENSLTGISVESTSCFRVLLLGIHKMIAAMAQQYRQRFIYHKRFQVLLPLSPNHGSFGRDGLYAEMKLALEALLYKRESEYEDWGQYCNILGCRIGWVRGTGLMELNDIVAPELEKDTGCKTFHRSEMALLLFSLFAWSAKVSFSGSLLANLSGKLDQITDLNQRLKKIRGKILGELETERKLHEMNVQVRKSSSGNTGQNVRKNARVGGSETISPLAHPMKIRGCTTFPSPPLSVRRKKIGNLSMLEKSRVICAVGFAEVSPGGNAHTRWELEKNGFLSLEGAVELAWMMGFIESKRDHWVDKESKEKILDWQVKEKYENKILEHSGIRVVDPKGQGFDPLQYPAFTDVVLEHDFVLPMVNEEEAYRCEDADNENTEVYFDEAREQWFIRKKKGSVIKVQKAMSLQRYVAGQIPSGWDPELYGIERGMIEQVDRTALFAIISTAEAFLHAGLAPVELYKYMHPADVGSTLGGGMGGMQKLKRMFQDHRLDQKRQHDTLQETLINVTVAWAITSLVGAIGPIQTPVAACATAGISVEMAVSLLEQGKARFVIAGGFDDLGEEGMLGFGDMDATANNVAMDKKGISARRMSRPNDVRRGGFVEAQGGGAVLLTTADVALKMGLPVRGIVAFAASHADGIQASIPAPGLGLVAVARENQSDQQTSKNQLPSFTERKRMYDDALKSNAFSTSVAKSQLRAQCFHDFWKRLPGVSPLRGALAVYGATCNDIDIVFKHDTSTNANDPNECRLHNEIQRKLGREAGRPLFVASQKSLTGHSKGGAASWQINGLLQSLQEGVCPPNFSLDDVDSQMNEFEYLVFTDEKIRIGEHRMKAGLLTSLGFGHVGALILALHPDYFYALLTDDECQGYLAKRAGREQASYQRMHSMKLDIPMYQARKESWVGTVDEEVAFYTDSQARL